MTARSAAPSDQRPPLIPSQPFEGTRFIGREDDLAALRQRFDGCARLVTITGPPGIGKTRIALRFLDLHPDVVGEPLFCDLRQATTLDELFTHVARLLEVSAVEKTDDMVGLLGERIASRGSCFLVLDNLEPIACEAAPGLSRWLREAPGLRLLVTSRRSLRLRGESVYELPPLSGPVGVGPLAGAPGGIASMRPLAFDWSCEALVLFCDRARSVEPAFDPAPEQRPVVAELVHKLEGNPLAIELAAAQIRRAGPRDLLERFQRAGLEYRTHYGDLEPGHATLREAIEGSWCLLSVSEQRVLAGLTVFRGGFTLAAAEAILTDLEGVTLDDVSMILGDLREASLLGRGPSSDPSGGSRWGFFEAIREFASERLSPKEHVDLCARHATYFLAWGESWVDQLTSSGALAARLALPAELGNLQQAVAWFELASKANPVLQGRMALVLYESVRRWLPSLAAAPLDRALARIAARDSTEDRRLRSRLHLARAVVARDTDRPDEAEEHFRASRSLVDAESRLACEVGYEEAKALIVLGSCQEARERLEQALQVARAYRDVSLENRIEYVLSRVLAEAFLDPTALDHSARSLALAYQLGDLCEVARATVIVAVQRLFFHRAVDSEALVSAVERLGQHRERVEEAMGYTAIGADRQERGSLTEARSAYERARDLSMAIGLQRTAGLAVLRIGNCFDEERSLEEARLAYERGIAILDAAGDSRFASLGRIFLAGVRARVRDPQGAESLLAEAERQTESLRPTGFEDLLPLQRALVDLMRSRNHEDLGEHEAAARLRDRADRRLEEAQKPRRHLRGSAEVALCEVSCEARTIIRILEAERARSRSRVLSLRLRRDLTAFQVVGEDPVPLPRGRVLGRLLQALVLAHVESPGADVPNEDLMARCWPGERFRSDVGLRRIRESVRRLRRMGLDRLVLTTEGGYLLDPKASVSFVESE